MTADPADCCAVLLRGGRSRRMGVDKASLPWKEGLTFLQVVAGQMDFLPEKYLSVAALACDASAAFQRAGSTRDAAWGLSRDWIVLPDLLPDCGPMGGIWTALTACRAGWALVSSCDIPAVQRSLFEFLLMEREKENAYIIFPVTPDGRMHLTCALYRKSAAPVLEKQIRNGDYRLRSLLSRAGCRAVPVEDPSMIRMLSNVNTKEDLHRVLRRPEV